MNRTNKYATLYERLVANTHDPESVNGCWIWKGAVGGSGYGRINIRVDGAHKAKDAHRTMSGVLLGRPLLPIEHSDHLCFNRRCINPDHLNTVHYLENLKRRRNSPITVSKQSDHIVEPPTEDNLQLSANRAWIYSDPSFEPCPF